MNANREDAHCAVEVAASDLKAWRQYLTNSVLAMNALLLGPAHRQFAKAIDDGATVEEQSSWRCGTRF